MPAWAGTRVFLLASLDPRFRGDDGEGKSVAHLNKSLKRASTAYLAL